MNAIDSSNFAPMFVLCAVAIFVILFAIILRTLRQMPFFYGSNPVPIAVCVTLLCILGLHQLFVQPAGTETAPADDARRSLDFLLLPYTAMALAMLVLLFSLAGVPPLVGFFGKLYVLRAAYDAGLAWLAIAGVVASVIGAFYYLRVVKLMYFDAPVEKSPIVVPLTVRTLMIVNGLAVALLGLFPDWLMMICFAALGGSLYLS